MIYNNRSTGEAADDKSSSQLKTISIPNKTCQIHFIKRNASFCDNL